MEVLHRHDLEVAAVLGEVRSNFNRDLLKLCEGRRGHASVASNHDVGRLGADLLGVLRVRFKVRFAGGHHQGFEHPKRAHRLGDALDLLLVLRRRY